MAEGKDASSIHALNAASQREAWPLVGLILLDMAATVVAIYIIGVIANSL